MPSFPSVDRCFGLIVLAASLHLATAARAETPHAYSLEGRYFFGQPEDPNPIVKIYVSGDRHRVESYFDGKLRQIKIVRPDRRVLYLTSESPRTYEERSFEKLGIARWPEGDRGHSSLEEYRAREREGKLVLTPMGSETINGQACEKYSIAFNKHVVFHLWVSTATGFPVLRTMPGSSARVEWSNLKVAPQPAGLFEPPRGYRKVP